MNVQIMVYGYLAVCVSMIVFNLFYVAIYRRGERNSRRIDKRIRDVREQVLMVEEGKTVSADHIKMLCRRCKNIWSFVSLDEQLTELAAEHAEAVEQYTKQIEKLFVYLSMELRKKDPIQQAHFAYMVEKYNIVDKMPISNIMSFMLEMVQSPNLYCRQNALRVLYEAGDENAVLEAVQLLSDSKFFHHEKLLTDGLLSFCGDRESLISKLMEQRKRYSQSMQQVILNVARFGSGKHREEFFRILLDENEDDELRFSAVRYFGKYTYAPAEKVLQEYAEFSSQRRWEYAAIAATALAAYPGEETIRILKGCLSNANWYVRQNAAVSLEQFNLPYAELAEIYDGQDRYAREILQYRMELKQYKQQTREAARV